MVNILFDCYNIDDFKEELSPYFSKDSRVAVIAFSFYGDAVYDAESWERVFGKGRGYCYFETVNPLSAFGVEEENVTFINYYTDTPSSAKEKIRNANVLYFTGGLPDKMMERIAEFGLEDVLKAFDGVIFGYSAGAVIQLKEYHLYPDGDYQEFAYYEGLGYLDKLYLEVHYEYKPEQNESIARALSERHLPVYVTHTFGGGLIVEQGSVLTVGKVDLYRNE